MPIDSLSSTSFLKPNANSLLHYLPEPRNSLGSGFKAALSSVSDVLGLGNLSAVAQVPSEYAALISEQVRVQQEMMVVTFVSNIEKSRHETQMAAVRNVRTS